MIYQIVPMNKSYAGEMIERWKYPNRYSMYDYVNEKEELLNETLWGLSKFAVLDKDKNLFGELTIEFFKNEEEGEGEEDDRYVDHNIVLKNPVNSYELWIGFGMRPDACGKGYGENFVLDCISFAISHYKYKGEYIRCAVSSWNQRAISLYKKIGFELFNQFEFVDSKEIYTIYQMKKEI